MSDPGGCAVRRPPTAAEVVGRLKDDGDFDALRRAIVRKVKDNEALRNKIISEVKQSVVLQEEGSERMKLKDLSDAIFQDIGSKIMGEISDEVWSVIRSNETDIQGTVKAVYNRIMNPETVPEPSSKKLKREGKDERVLPTKAATAVSVEAEDDVDPVEPPGFGFGNTQRKPPMNLENHNEAKPNEGEPAAISNPGDEDDDPEVPPGFG